MLRSVLILVLCSLTSVPTTSPDDTYPIKLARPLKVGDQLTASVVFAYDRQYTSQEQGYQPYRSQEKFKAELSGSFKVLSTNAAGQPTSLACTVEKCAKIESDRRIELAKPGDVLIVEPSKKTATLRGGDPVARLENGALDIKTAGILSKVMGECLTMFDGNEAFFGTAERHKSGDSWAANTDAIQAELRKETEGDTGTKDSVRGSATLVRATVADNVPCLEIQQRTVTNHHADHADIPTEPAVEVEAQSLSVVTIPVDPVLPVLSKTVARTRKCTGDGLGLHAPKHAEWEVHITFESHVNRSDITKQLPRVRPASVPASTNKP